MFAATPALAVAAAVLLVFDGVKMAADVYVNGVLVSGAGLADQHLRYDFDVTSQLQRLPSGARNNVTVHIPLPSNDTRNDEGRFAACSGGWDWSQYSVTTTPGGLPYLSFGIWKSVYLVPVNSMSLHAVVPLVFFNAPYPVEPLTDATAGPWTVAVTVHLRAGPSGLAPGGLFTATADWGSISAPLPGLAANQVLCVALAKHEKGEK